MIAEFTGTDWSQTTLVSEFLSGPYFGGGGFGGNVEGFPFRLMRVNDRQVIATQAQLWERIALSHRMPTPAFDWSAIASFRAADPIFAIEHAGSAQAFMQWKEDFSVPCAEASRSRLVYVSFLEVAPRNRGSNPWFKGLGTLLLRFACQRSLELGSEGKLGLHALPTAVSFYRQLGFAPLTCPNEYRELYLELTGNAATAFLATV